MKKKLTKFCFIIGFFLTQSFASHAQDFFSGSSVFASVGPIFSTGASGFFQAGWELDFEKIDAINLSMGPQIGMVFAKGFFAADFDAFLKAKYEIEISETFGLNLYGRLPLGLSLGGAAKSFIMGFNIGLIPGCELNFKKNFGVIAELGFIHHSYWGVKNTLLKYHAPTGVFNVGMIYRF